MPEGDDNRRFDRRRPADDGADDRSGERLDAWGHALPGELHEGAASTHWYAEDGTEFAESDGEGHADAARFADGGGEGAWTDAPCAATVGGRGPALTRRTLIAAAAGGLVAVGLAAWGISSCVAGRSRKDGSAAGARADAVPSSAAGTPVDDSPATDAPAVGTTVAGEEGGVATLVLDRGRTTSSGSGRLTFSAVGDNLANDNILALADSWAGSPGDGAYDFSPFYAEVAPVVRDGYDVSFINQETVLGGTETFDYMSYPSYNTPDSMADAVAAVGWRVVNLGTNHTYDIWTDGIEHALDVWGSHDGVLTCGSYRSEEDRQTVRMFECNGIRVAVLAYCYGQNGYELSDLPNNHYAVAIDETTIRTDVARARDAADAVLVYMHWGDEYTFEPSDEQRYYAQVCADAGVDVVIGSHVHVVQPVEWVARAGGGRMLCAFGLGDFLSGYHNNPKTVLSGMVSFDFARVAEGEASLRDDVGPGGIAVENVVWHPLVEHMEGGTDTVRFVKTYAAEDAVRNELLAGLDNPRQWLVDTTAGVVGTSAAAIDV